MEELMAGVAAVTGRSTTAEDLRQFTTYLDVFLRWNRVHRMTALDSPVAIVRELFLDSLLFLSVLPAGGLTVVDLGAGAGIPGLPMRLAQPQIRMTLVESKRKRVSFLRTVCRELGLVDVEVEEGRAELLALRDPELRGVFDVAVSRAVGAPEALLPLALPYLKRAGILVVSGPPGHSDHHGCEEIQVHIPGKTRHRRFLRARKGS